MIGCQKVAFDKPFNVNNGCTAIFKSGSKLQINPGATISGLSTGDIWFVDADNGDDDNNGQSFGAAFKTIQAAVDVAATGDTIFVTGSFTEAVVVDTAGISIIGLGTQPVESTWTADADENALTLNVANCWVENIRFRPPAYTSGTPAAIVLHNAPYTRIIGCRFQGKTGSYYAIFCHLDATHSSDNVWIEGCDFVYMNNVTTVYGSCIVSTASDGGYSCSSWRIINNIFAAPAAGIDINGRGCVITGNQFIVNGLKADGTMGAVTGSAGSKKMIDLSGTSSSSNFVSNNYLGGTYSATLYAVSAANDAWVGNLIATGLTGANPS